MPEAYVQRAELLADLGRYDEAAAELERAVAIQPDYAAAHTLLARVRLAAGSPKDALAAAQAAVDAAPADVDALVARGMIFADLGRVDEAAADAQQILRRGRGNGYACTSAAAILAEVRNGQVALDAAWEGVRLSPEQSRAHLVLGVVAARLGLSEVAARAYQEALRLDPQLSVAHAALGVVRLEQHRYARALSHLADADADAGAPPGPGTPHHVASGLRRMLYLGAGYAMVAPVLVACAGRSAALWALFLAGAGMAGLVLAYTRLPDEVRTALPETLRQDRPLAVAAGAVAVAPALLVVFALVPSPWPLVGAITAGAVALLAGRSRTTA